MKEYFKHKTVWLTLLVVLAIMFAIFWLSAQTVQESTETSGHFVDIFIKMVYPDFDSMSEADREAALDAVTHIIRKLAHFTEYAALGFFLALHFYELRSRLGLNLKYVWAEIIGILYAVSDELHQFFVPGRGPGVADVLIDSAGALAGIAIMLCLIKLFCRKNDDGGKTN